MLLTVIGKLQRALPIENKLPLYLGLLFTELANSNEIERSGRITKQGNKLARTALMQCWVGGQEVQSLSRSFYE